MPTDTPQMGDKDACRHCGSTIEYVGPYWRHTTWTPRHKAEPGDRPATCNSAIRSGQLESLWAENCHLRRQLAEVTAERDRLRDALGMQPLPAGPEETHGP